MIEWKDDERYQDARGTLLGTEINVTIVTFGRVHVFIRDSDNYITMFGADPLKEAKKKAVDYVYALMVSCGAIQEAA